MKNGSYALKVNKRIKLPCLYEKTILLKFVLGKHLIWLQDALTPESICVGCLNIRKTLVSSLRQPIAQGYGRGRFPRNNRPDFTSTRSTK